MSWSIKITINETSKAEAFKLLDRAVDEIKTKDEVFIDGEFNSDGRLIRLKYNSYKGIQKDGGK